MAGVERVSVHVSRLAHCPDVFFVEFSRAGSVGNLVVPLDRSEAEALRDELGEALSGRITEAPDVSNGLCRPRPPRVRQRTRCRLVDAPLAVSAVQG